MNNKEEGELMFFGKKQEAKSTQHAEVTPAASAAKAEAKTEKKTKPTTKVVYRVEDRGEGNWTIHRSEVPREQELGPNEFPKLLAAQKAIYADISARLTKLKEIRASVKALRKAGVLAAS